MRQLINMVKAIFTLWVSFHEPNITVMLVEALTHWGRVTHICVDNLTTIGSDNGLSPGRRQAITWTNVGILLIGPQGTNFSEMLVEIHTFSFKKIHFKMPSGKWRPFCLGLNVLTLNILVVMEFPVASKFYDLYHLLQHRLQRHKFNWTGFVISHYPDKGPGSI